MATFTIRVKEVNHGYIVVNADSRKQAKEKAKDVYWRDGVGQWSDGSVEFALTYEKAEDDE